MSRLMRRVAPLAVVGLVAAGCSSSPGTKDDGDIRGDEVTVIGTWGGDEQEAFLAMVKPWEEQTGAKVKYTGTRDLNTVLTTGVASGVLPDLAGLPGPGQLVEYAEAGALVPLGDVLDIDTYTADTAPALVELGKGSDGEIYGVFIKAAVKGLIWYNPSLHDYSSEPPSTWDELLAQGAANQGDAEALWCVGIESGAASGWPATDWIEDLVLRTAGADVYTQWYRGEIKWSDPRIREAFEIYVEDVLGNTYGGRQTAAALSFDTAGDPLFAEPPGCVFHHQASFITGLGGFKDAQAGVDYNFFPFPDINPAHAGAVEGAGDLFGMFNDTPAARSLMRYLVSAEAQDIWVKRGGALSANKNATSYPDDISARSAQILTDAQSFVFDASDLMPQAMNDAFWRGMVALTSGSASLDQVLADLDAAQADAYASS
jgi:alpha-glucoside transport system substrate-binding protein